MEIVGDYEYSNKDLIGHGAFAVVFKGRHRKNPSYVVAIKSITKKNLAKSQNLLGKEIKILKELTELHHENVVALLDCKETSHNVFLVMEFCNGGDLADYLGVKGTLSEDTIRLFLVQLAGAMRALHAKGIVHRDLKPQNILLSHSGGKACPQPHEIRLKIADFGFARFLQDGVMAATLCGSPMYMAPEVIMSLQYDAKADLWSLGTIVFQCLTGKAPFQAQTPQALKQFYEKNSNLAPKIPAGTSPELTDLLNGLLRRNARDRLPFDSFFNHPFLQRRQEVAPSPPPHPTSVELASSPGTLFLPPAASPVPPHLECNPSEPGSPVSCRGEADSSSSPEETDDFVLVPANIPSDHSSDSGHADNRHRVSRAHVALASPPRPSSLPISEPIPVPTQKEAYQQLVPSPSPTRVQFMLGTTPPSIGQRRRSASGSSCETPPPVTTWQVSPVSAGKITPSPSPLRHSGTSSPLLSGPLAMLPPILGSPTRASAENNNLQCSPVLAFGTRAMTLPEISVGCGFQRLFSDPPTQPMDEPIMFLPPELPEETLLEREHNETLAKLNFALALADCVLDAADARAAPLAALTDSTAGIAGRQSEGGRRAEQLVLLVRALQLLSSALGLASQQLRAAKLRPSASVKSVVAQLNSKFRQCLAECKQLNTPGLLQKAGVDPSTTNITADRLLYNHAIHICQTAALDELFDKPKDCFQRYSMAQLILHSLAQTVHHPQDRDLLIKYKDAVEKRLFVLEEKGHIYST
ncbi:serine/threonine-protein kinase unc-51 isoform X2 [Bacillus rossius redtenbacheri]|uniref:serine/threonine-protein kinase unc-51 isoform X2 n=1 Tax=Bacillus rossius redtenbacheri TaxID=93214 RepID=UPI002FDCBA8C